jgi:hypothetical protein
MLSKLNKSAGAVSLIVMLVGMIVQAIWMEAKKRSTDDQQTKAIGKLEAGSDIFTADRVNAAAKLANLDARMTNIERLTSSTDANVKAMYELMLRQSMTRSANYADGYADHEARASPTTKSRNRDRQ